MISPGLPWPGISRGLKESFNTLLRDANLQAISRVLKNVFNTLLIGPRIQGAKAPESR